MLSFANFSKGVKRRYIFSVNSRVMQSILSMKNFKIEYNIGPIILTSIIKK